jgi:acyl-CoA synthetase (NDP forming)
MSSSKSAFACIKQFTKFIDYDYSTKTLDIATPESDNSNLASYALTEYDSKKEMSNYGFTIPSQCIVNNVEEISDAVANMNYPLVLKINSPDILHKTDAGGVKLNVNSVDEAIIAYNDILTNCKEYKSDAKVEGVIVQEMAPIGTEIIIGINNDAQFGPMILVGLGGIFVEVFKDAVLYPVPVNKSEAIGMLKQLKAYKLLNGYRGSETSDIDALADLIVKVSDYAYEHKEDVKEIDLNPVFVYPKGKGVCVIDSLIVKYKDYRGYD